MLQWTGWTAWFLALDLTEVGASSVHARINSSIHAILLTVTHDHWSVLVWKREHERYWHPTPPQPQPHMITGQCLCGKENMNVMPVCASEHERYWHPNPNPDPTWSLESACVCKWTHDHWSVLVCASEHERYWNSTQPQPEPQPHMITGQCLCVQVNTWSLVSACVCKWTWTLLHPTPPHPQPQLHMITGQCLCVQVNTWSLVSACVCASEHER